MSRVRADESGGSSRSALVAQSGVVAEPGHQPRRIGLGLLTYCFGLAQKFSAQVPGVPNYRDPLVFIREAARIGADAVQIPFGVLDAAKIRSIRAAAEELGVALESTLGLPDADSGMAAFEAEMRGLHELGVKVVRTVVFAGRRYEDLHSYDEYKSAVARARERINRAEPIARANQIRLAIENHKDQRIEERVALFQEFQSEYIGACLDVGNNISLLEDPVEVARALTPWALTVHFKDQGVRESADGFELADVPLGQGCIDLKEVVRVVREKKPRIHLQLELITRDPLRVPVLTKQYWASFPDAKAAALARTWALVKERGSREPFPRVSQLSPAEQVAMERRNVEESFQYAAEHLGF